MSLLESKGGFEASHFGNILINNNKKMRKIIASLLTAGMTLSVVGPALAIANGGNITGDVSTGLTRSTGGGQAPIVKAKWEMNGPLSTVLGTANEGTDDDTAAGAQFMAPGVWEAYKDLIMGDLTLQQIKEKVSLIRQAAGRPRVPTRKLKKSFFYKGVWYTWKEISKMDMYHWNFSSKVVVMYPA